MDTTKISDKLTLSFDIGHSSIGWSVFSVGAEFPSLLGAGVVLFQKDSCLASSRRANRRVRRNIAARRSRVDRLKKYICAVGVLTREELDENATAFPWFLAARVLASGGTEKLSWKELWAVLRWYAHNRGYDGNALWAGDDVFDDEEALSTGDDDDAEKVKNARALMQKFNKETAAETICAFLGIDLTGDKRSSTKYFKGENVAFPRDTVVKEVRKILEAHTGVLQKMDANVVRVLLEDASEQGVVKLPSRFRGGLLFGQYVPRFDNRIIGKCRITGKNVPLKSCKEFLLYRWARVLNNLTVFDAHCTSTNGVRLLTASERVALHTEMVERGFFNKKSLNEALKRITHCEPANTESYFLTEEMEEALVLDPVKKCIASRMFIKDLWPLFSERGKKIFATKLSRGEKLRLTECVRKMKDWGGWDASAFEAKFAELQQAKPKNKKKEKKDLKKLIISVEYPKGRAPYSKEIMRKAVDEVLQGIDPVGPDGCLYETPEIQSRQLNEPLAAQTNNHMVRHRLTIFSRLLDDIVSEYANGDEERICDVVVEVVKELKEFSGLDAKKLAAQETEKMKNFSTVAKKLEDAAAGAGVVVTASMIRKARLLEDQEFVCPYTGALLSYNELFAKRLHADHIIPRSFRISDSLDSLVMTSQEVNDMKGQRTAMRFIKEFQGKPVPGTNLTICSENDFREWIKKHAKRWGKKHWKGKNGKSFENADVARCKKRAELLQIENYDKRNADFTERDLTQTSYLNKMAIRLVERKFKGVHARHLPGIITAFVRKNMNIAQCLVAAVPRMQGRDSLTKTKMRDLTHLHHAMDAITQGLTGIFFRTEDWKALAQRKICEFDRIRLANRYSKLLTFSESGNVEMRNLPETLRENIRQMLEECRVVQHIPSRMHGMVVEQTTWRIEGVGEKTKMVKISQKQRDQKTGKCSRKQCEEKASLLLGYGETNGKLQKIKGVVKICENWGCVLDPVPVVVPYFKVFPKLRELIEKNGGKRVRILRNGMMISVKSGTYRGIWTVRSIKDKAIGVALDMTAVDRVKIEGGGADSKGNVLLKTLLKNGLEILKPKLTGIPQCRSTLLQ